MADTPALDDPKIEAPRTIEAQQEPNRFKRAYKILGPGLITGASDDDPSGIATYSSVGAGFGYSALWMSIITYPLMLSVQYICAKVGLVTGRGLSGTLKRHYHPAIVWVSIVILLIANVINAGTDIGAMAEGVHLLAPTIPAKSAIIPIAIILGFTLIAFSYKRIASVLKWLTLSLFAYVITAFFCHLDFKTVLKDTFIPNVTMQPSYIAALVAILGTTISPYLFFWQSNTEVDEQKDAGQKEIADRKGASDNDLKFAAYDVGAGMFFSNLVMYFIILTAAATLYKSGIHQIDSAAQAAKALEPMLGSTAKYLFAAGFIGTGFLAVPVLIGSAAYAIAEALGHPCGYGEKFGDAKVYYGLVIASILVGMCINFMNINAMQALYWTAILNGILAPPLLLVLMLVSNDKKIMGKRTNSLLVNIGGWSTFGIMSLAVVLFLWTSFVK